MTGHVASGLIRSGLIRGAFCLATLTLMAPGAGAGEAEIQRLRREYPAAAKGLEGAYSRVRASGTLRRVRPGSASASEMRVEIWTTDGQRKAVLRGATPGRPAGGVEHCYAIGRESMFAATSGPGSNGSWILSDAGRVAPSGPARDISGIETKFNELGGKYLLAPYRLNGWPGPDFLDEARFRVSDAEEAFEGGRHIMRVRYAARAPGASARSGTVELLPDRSWAVKRHEYHGLARGAGRPVGPGDPFQIVLDVEYEGGGDGPPRPGTVRYSGSVGTSEFRFDKVEFGVETPAREFTPASCGLPDVTAIAPDPSRSNLSYWLFGVAACASVAAVVVRRRG